MKVIEKLDEIDQGQSAAGGAVNLLGPASALRQSSRALWRNEDLCRATLAASLRKVACLNSIGRTMKFDSLVADVNTNIRTPNARAAALQRLAGEIKNLFGPNRMHRYELVKSTMHLPAPGTPLADHEAQCLVALAHAGTSLGAENDAVHAQLEPYLPFLPIARRLEMISALGNAQNDRATQPRRYRLLTQVEALNAGPARAGELHQRIQDTVLPDLMIALASPLDAAALRQSLTDLERFPEALHGRGLANIVHKAQYFLSTEELHAVYGAKLAAFDEPQVADFITGCGAEEAVLEAGGLLEAARRLSAPRRSAALSELASCYPDSETLGALRADILAEIASLPAALQAAPLTSFADSKAELCTEFTEVLGLAAGLPPALRKPITDILIEDLNHIHSDVHDAHDDVYATLLQENFFPNLGLHTSETRSAMLKNIGRELMNIDDDVDGIIMENFRDAVNALPQNQRLPVVTEMAANIFIGPSFFTDAHDVHVLADNLIPAERAQIGTVLARALGSAPPEVLDHIIDQEHIYEGLEECPADLKAPLVTILAGHVMRSAKFAVRIDDIRKSIAELPRTHRAAPLTIMARNLQDGQTFSQRYRMILQSAAGLSHEQMTPIYEQILSNIRHAPDGGESFMHLLTLTAPFTKARRVALLSPMLDTVLRGEPFADLTAVRAICEAMLNEAECFSDDDHNRIITAMLDRLPNADAATFKALQTGLEAKLVNSWLN